MNIYRDCISFYELLFRVIALGAVIIHVRFIVLVYCISDFRILFGNNPSFHPSTQIRHPFLGVYCRNTDHATIIMKTGISHCPQSSFSGTVKMLLNSDLLQFQR